MFAWNPKRLFKAPAISLYLVLALSGCSGNSGDTFPFSELTSGDGFGAAASFKGPAAIATDGTNLYVADSLNNTIRKVTISSGFVLTVAGSLNAVGATDGTGAGASFDQPPGITTDGTNLYVADASNNSIRKIVKATGAVTTLVGATGNLKHPVGIAVQGTNLYVANTTGHNIQRVNLSTGAVADFVGSATNVVGSADGTGTAAFFNAPEGLATDGTFLYVADQGNNIIRKVEIATGVVTTLAGAGGAVSTDAPTGTAGTAGAADGVGAAAQFKSPTGVTTDGTNLYVVDEGNNTIRKIVIGSGAVTTLAGTAGTSGSKDGIGAAALFKSPSGIISDATNIYVADTSNNTIRKIVIASGVVSTLAGSPPSP